MTKHPGPRCLASKPGGGEQYSNYLPLLDNYHAPAVKVTRR